VKRALNDILGENGWRSDTQAGSQWIFATDRAKPRSTVPQPPVDRSPDDEFGPPSGDPLF
jgi:hypothetical protein